LQTVTYFTNSELKNYSPSAFAKIISDFINHNYFEIILFSNTSFGKDLAPRVAAKIDCGIMMDCTKLEIADNDIIATRPIYAGKANQSARLRSPRKVFTLRPNVFKAIKLEYPVELKVNNVKAEILDLSTRVLNIKKSEGNLDVAEADIIVSAGRGIKGPENFYLIENLAEVLGAAVGASRAVVDAGWRPHSNQVGQTGKTVTPNLYIACGISGAIQHVAGMSSSKFIVAINKDKDAPIFSIADYGIVGDLFDIVPVLTEEIKKTKS
jgi:electron transfer flavoprotein alpha subunit